MSPYLMRLFALCLPAFLPTLAYAAQSEPTPTPATSPMQSAQPNPAPTASATATAAASPTPLPAARPFTVTGKRVVFYSDRFVVTADENVVVTLADGTRITGNTFMMYLKLNRFVIAGDVRIRTKAGQVIPGAAFAEYFDFDRAYFVPITTEPDRWTFVGNDFEKPLRGREMPGDTFFLPDLSNEHVFLYGGKALIAPRESVRFTPASINLNFVGNKPVAFVPTPSYYFNFSSNPNFAQNGLAGAYFDAPYPFAGGAHGSATAHLRYDEINQLYLSYEQHLAITDKSYVVLSANPLTRPQRQYNLLAMDHVSPKIQTQLFVQENVFQLGLSQPLSAGAFSQLKTTVGLHQSFLQWNLDNAWESLLANPCPTCAPSQALFYGTPEHIWIPDHGSDSQLSWTGFDHRVARTVPLSYRLRSGIGFVHDSYAPPGSLGGVSYPALWQHFVGFTLFTPSLIIKTAPFRAWHLNAVLDKQEQAYSEPHHVDTTQTSVTASKTFDKHVSAYIGYSITNTGDYYGALQSQAYPPQIPVSPITGQSYPGYAAFEGLATSHSLSESLIWTASQNLTLNLIWRENHDFPIAVPYMVAPLAFGQSMGNQQGDIGVSPQQLTGDLRIRLRPNLLVDLTRSYYFNWGNRRWTPQFTFLISK
jgi:hypothetical protein